MLTGHGPKGRLVKGLLLLGVHSYRQVPLRVKNFVHRRVKFCVRTLKDPVAPKDTIGDVPSPSNERFSAVTRPDAVHESRTLVERSGPPTCAPTRGVGGHS